MIHQNIIFNRDIFKSTQYAIKYSVEILSENHRDHLFDINE